MNQRHLTSSRYSPGNLAPDALERLLVGREQLVEELTQKVRKSVTSAHKHYVLLVGPRGVGKTHLIALVYHRIASTEAFSPIRGKFLVAYLNEEEWGVASFLDFLLVILRSLQAHEPALEPALADIQLQFESSAERARDAAEELLIRTVGDRTLVLLCENLSDLFGALGAEGQARWRAMVQQHPFWCVIATTPSLFFAISRQTEPFYGFFTIRSLDNLSFDAALELLRKKAELEDRPDLARFITTPVGRARIRAIHHIAGGNHRAYIVLSDFLTRETLNELVSPFLQMVDDLTPYYQERMRHITSPLQRKLVDYLCRQRRPVPVRDIARGALVQQQSAAKQLGELAKAGIVQRTPRGRESYYELAEPLMRICIEIKDNRTEYIRTFVDLLRHWFSSRELEKRHHERVTGGEIGSLDHVHVRAALEDYRRNRTDPFLEALKLEVDRCHAEQDLPGVVEAAGRRAEELGEFADYREAIRASEQIRNYGKAVELCRAALERYPDDSGLVFTLAHALLRLKQPASALVEFDRLLARSPDDVRAWCLRGDALYALARYDEVLVNEDRVLSLDPDHDHSYVMKVRALYQLGQKQAALELAEVHADRYPSATSLLSLAELAMELEENEIGLRACDQVLTLQPGSHDALCHRGTLLLRLRRYDDVLQNEARLLALEPDHWHSRYLRIAALCGLERRSEAMGEARAWTEQEPERLLAWRSRLETALDLGDLLEARHALREARRLDAADLELRLLEISVEGQLEHWPEAIEAAEQAALAFPGSTDASLARVWALLGGRKIDAGSALAGSLDLRSSSEDWLLEVVRRLREVGDLPTRDRFTEGAVVQFPDSADLLYEHALALVDNQQYGRAEAITNRLADLRPEDVRVVVLRSLVRTSSAGLAQGWEVLHRLLENRALDEDRAAERLAALFVVEASTRSPASLFTEIRDKLPWSSQTDAMVARAIIGVLALLVKGNVRNPPRWAEALRTVDDVFHKAPKTRMAIRMLSAAVQFVETREIGPLLELPLEQRSLLMEEIKSQ